LNNGFCIPASIEVVTKYFDRGFDVDQDYIWRSFAKACVEGHERPNEISLSSVKKFLLDLDTKFSSWLSSQFNDGEPNFEEFVRHVNNGVDHGVPVIISVPAGKYLGQSLWHMLTVLGFDHEKFLVHDPNPAVEAKAFEVPIQKVKSDLFAADSKTTHSLILRPK